MSKEKKKRNPSENGYCTWLDVMVTEDGMNDGCKTRICAGG